MGGVRGVDAGPLLWCPQGQPDLGKGPVGSHRFRLAQPGMRGCGVAPSARAADTARYLRQ
eukprot:8478869-Alexandrium_andersonii.AAC.1